MDASDLRTIRYEVRDRVGLITLNRPQVWIDQHSDVRSSVEDAGVLLGSMMGDRDYARGVRALLDKVPPDFE